VPNILVITCVCTMAAYNESEILLDYVTRSLTEEEEFHFLRFEFLQRLNIVHMQTELARRKSRFQKERKATDDDMNDLKIKMRDYGDQPDIQKQTMYNN
jgi:hypothetical protein